MRRPTHILIVSLGCAKNLVDTEVICGGLASAGFVLTNEPSVADVMLINTCAFVADARAEAAEEIEEALCWKRERRGRKLVVAGCLPQQAALTIANEFPDVDLFLGPDDVPAAARKIRRLMRQGRGSAAVPEGMPTYLYDHDTPRLQLTPRNYAYVKIAEGCDHRCAFCTIPSIRGRQRSRDMSSVVAECEQLLSQGVKELIFVAQDTTRYGVDRRDGSSLAELLRRCDQLSDDFWLRVMYAHPRYVTEEVLEVLVASAHVVPYVDIPLQHITDRMLRAMGRGLGEDATRALMGTLRERWPQSAVRTTFLVGYPGETDEDFETLCRYVSDYRFERLGVFAFCPEEGTRAAALRDGMVPPEVAVERRGRLLELQQGIALELNQERVGKDLRVLVEQAAGQGEYVGRTAADAPDVDDLVHFTGPAGCVEQGFVTVKISDAEPYDLYGVVVADL